MAYILLAIGLLLLIKGADVLVGSASKLARILGVPPFIIGLSIIAFGTSAPEAAIGVFSGIRSMNELTLGDVIGSSIANIALVVGLTAIIIPLTVEKIISLREIPISFVLQLILVFMILSDGILTRFDSFILILLFLIFMYYLSKKTVIIMEKLKIADCGPALPCEDEMEEELEEFMEKEEVLTPDIGILKDRRKELLRLSGMTIAGIATLVFGAELIVDSAMNIARNLNLSEEFIGVTIISVGTSLPELVTSIMAALKKEEELAVGNIIGSNIFNIAFVLGISGMINPIAKSNDTFIDMVVMCVATLMIFIPSIMFEKISRRSGFVFLSYYMLFIAYKISLL
jgi:cation:H+ antiporter